MPRSGTCPTCGRDLVVKTSAKTRGSFAGCMGWPDCDVTYPLPQGKIEAIDGDGAVCPNAVHRASRYTPSAAARTRPASTPPVPPTKNPTSWWGSVPACKAAGTHGDLVAHKSERTGKRFIRCTNYDVCGTSYPLPARGTLHSTGEVCPDCGAPVVEVITQRGPWRICVNMDCPRQGEGCRREGLACTWPWGAPRRSPVRSVLAPRRRSSRRAPLGALSFAWASEPSTAVPMRFCRDYDRPARAKVVRTC